MFTLLLEKELIKYEVTMVTTPSPDIASNYNIFINIASLQSKNGLYLGIKHTDLDIIEMDEKYCKNAAYSTMQVYNLARNMNCLTNSMIWPLIIVMDYQKKFLDRKFVKSIRKADSEIEADSEEVAEGCMQCDAVYIGIRHEIRKLSNDLNESRVEYKSDLDFLFISNQPLFTTLKLDVNTVLENKMFSLKKFRNQESKLKEVFARLGISRLQYSESFVNLDCSIKDRLNNCLRHNSSFYKQMHYNQYISAVENYFLISYYLINSSFLSVLNLKNEKYLNFDHAFFIYNDLVGSAKKYFYRLKQARNFRYLVYTDKIVYSNRVLYLKTLIAVLKTFLRRSKKDCEIIAIHDCKEPLIVVENQTMKKYIDRLEITSVDTDDIAFSLSPQELKKFYKGMYK